MKKINYIIAVGAIASITLTQSCQQPKPDQTAIDAKVTEAYNAAKLEAENAAATACEENIAAQVKVLQDSMSAMSATQQAALLAKTQKDLKNKQAAAAATAKKKAADAVKAKAKADLASKPKSVDQKLDDRFSGKTKAEENKSVDKKLDDRFSKTSAEKTKEELKAVDDKLNDRFK
jgi:hypothetical protein